MDSNCPFKTNNIKDSRLNQVFSINDIKKYDNLIDMKIIKYIYKSYLSTLHRFYSNLNFRMAYAIFLIDFMNMKFQAL